jgi:YHS domain-containing protein
MQVEKSVAPAMTASGAGAIYFCSDRCRDRFVANPDRFVRPAGGKLLEQDLRRQPMAQATDPVCGMTLDTDSAAAKREYGGTTYYFCNPGCAKAFDRSPEAFVEGTRSA